MIQFNPQEYRYASKRNLVYAANGMVATSQPLAAQAGLDILKKGGNAIDAAIATAACLTVLEPTSNGIGGDAFAIVYHNGKLHGLNASGKSPASISIKALKDKGFKEIPRFGFEAVTVPGAISGWVALSDKLGKLPFATLLEPAINYARNGFPLSPTLATFWERAHGIYSKHLQGEQYQEWFKTFAPNNQPPKTGEIWKSVYHANTLQEIANTKGESFYRGNLAKAIVDYTNKYQGYLSLDDLNNHQVQWVDPLSVKYRGFDIWELPPNTTGILTLDALNTLNHLKLPKKINVIAYHKQIEALKIAFKNTNHKIADFDCVEKELTHILDPEVGKQSAKLIKDYAQIYSQDSSSQSGTVYLATADNEGNMVSFIQSNYMGFGSGLVVPNTGIALQNRGHNFSFDETHVNALAPNKRPYHTLIPGFITKENKAVGPFGVMGGMMQPQGHLQVVSNLIDYHLNPQTALDAPRWQWIEKDIVHVEPSFNKNILKALQKRGHKITISQNIGSFGRGQIILKSSKDNVLIGATEMRTDGSIASW